MTTDSTNANIAQPTHNLPKSVKVVEVGPRDGLQNETIDIGIKSRISFIERLQASGVRNIEIGSFVSPRRVPQMAESDRVFKGVNKIPHCRYIALVANQQGLEKALACKINNIAVFCAASDTFTKKNVERSICEDLKQIEAICERAKTHKLWVRGYISCALGCPYEGDVPLDRVRDLATRLYHSGCDEISLGDTIGVATPSKVKALIDVIGNCLALETIAVHFHDTYGQALANILAAIQAGVSIVDSAVAGLGGCPFAPAACGNVATEDLIYMLHGLGIITGIDLDSLVSTAWFISKTLNRPPASKVTRAMTGSEFSAPVTV